MSQIALSAAMVFEIRSTGTANGGAGFKSGASGQDYSQQDAVQVTYDGSTNALTASGAGSTLSCPGRPFVADDVGNILNVTGGTNLTSGRYEIISVAAGVATLDRAVSTGASSNGTGVLGGACNNIATIFAAGVVAGNKIYFKGSFSLTSGVVFSIAGTVAKPIQFIGYATTRAAADDPAIGTEQATITATAAISPVLDIQNADKIIRNLHVDCNSLANYGLQCSANRASVHNCKVSNFLQRGFNLTGSGGITVEDCFATGGAGGAGTASDVRAGLVATGGVPTFIRCVSTSGSTNGFGIQNNHAFFVDCIARQLTQESGVGGHGLQIFGIGEARIFHCTFDNLAGSGLFNQGGSPGAISCSNNIFANISRFGMEGTTGSTALTPADRAAFYRNNAFWSNTLGRQGGAVTVYGAGTDEIILTADPFNSTTDLGLNNTAGGGALLRQAGIPGAFHGLSATTGYPDIGAVQASRASGAGVNAATMRTWWREWTNEETTSVIPDSVVDIYIGRGLEEFNRRVGFSWTDSTSDITLVAETQEYTVPSNTVQIAFVELNGQRVKKGDPDEWDKRGVQWRTEKSGTPTEWAFYANQLVFYPKPNAAAVAADSTPTIRFIRSPRDFTTYGPEQISDQDLAIPVYWGVYLWSAAFQDNATAVARADRFKATFEEAVAGASQRYLARYLQD